MQRIIVGVIFGGKSLEHDVSLISASSILNSISLEKYIILPIYISRDGKWSEGQDALELLSDKLDKSIKDSILDKLPPIKTQDTILNLFNKSVDVIFPVIHGPYGEDGTIQGLLEMFDLPYVGDGVLASSLAMDKVLTKKVLHSAGLPQANYTYCSKYEIESNINGVLRSIEQKIGYPMFVKPCNLGSSVGISKVCTKDELKEAVILASRYDRKVIIEEFVPAREVEIAVMGNDQMEVSLPGEILSSGEFYDYSAKYLDGKSQMEIPAKLDTKTIEIIQEMAKKVYKELDCSGLARIDFFINRLNGEVLINEINTMPGFTPYSMYPVLWKKNGLSYPSLLDRLIQLGIERHKQKKKLTFSS